MERVTKSFERQSIMQTFGAQMTVVEPGHVEISAPILPAVSSSMAMPMPV